MFSPLNLLPGWDSPRVPQVCISGAAEAHQGNHCSRKGSEASWRAVCTTSCSGCSLLLLLLSFSTTGSSCCSLQPSTCCTAIFFGKHASSYLKCNPSEVYTNFTCPSFISDVLSLFSWCLICVSMLSFCRRTAWASLWLFNPTSSTWCCMRALSCSRKP